MQPVNLGSGEEIPIRALVELIAELTGFRGRLVWDTSKPNGQPRRKLDTTRAEREFGWCAKATLREGLRRTIDWYEATSTTPSVRGVATTGSILTTTNVIAN